MAVWRLQGCHVSSQAPALAAELLGDVEDEGTHGGVALSPQAVGALVVGLASALLALSSSGSMIWPVPHNLRRRRARVRGMAMIGLRAELPLPLTKSHRAGLCCARCRAWQWRTAISRTYW